MSAERAGNSLRDEVEALKAKHGKELGDLQIVRFSHKKDGNPDWRVFTPYWCRADDEGFIQCEEERPI